jgi:hypothetical protein
MPEVKWVKDESRHPGRLTRKSERAEMSPMAETPRPPASGFGAPTPKHVRLATALKHHRKK